MIVAVIAFILFLAAAIWAGILRSFPLCLIAAGLALQAAARIF